ncbi:hypothetical protein SI65_03699 [Aspergillus cristatus]|uniref:Transcription factor domain-containing protein n=1 Tax=Aspergillus cristatus TaxID=573508 RepID=A0A1E3BJU8_ASPCR|nr:hypothetical protein SI65_03699 [Aspergillus cristatus]
MLAKRTRKSMPKVRSGCATCKFSDPTLWTELVLQRSQHQPVVRNALAALSFLYRDYIRQGSTPLGEDPTHLQVIAKSHRQLRAYLLSSRDVSPEPALICSLIFYILECLVGNAQQAIWHLDQGLMLLERCRTEYPGIAAGPDSIYKHLTAVYARLDIHASGFDNERIPILKLASPAQVAGLGSVVPDSFDSLSQADDALTILQNWMVHHLVALLIHRRQSEGASIPPDLALETLRLEHQFLQFVGATAKLASTANVKSDTIMQQRIALLQIQAQTFHAIFVERAKVPEYETDQLIDESSFQFDIALSNVSALYSNWRTDESSSRGFTLSTNIIATLYYICMKTKHRPTLQTALSLLQDSPFSARDGLWDAKTAASVVQGVMPKQEAEEVKLEDVGSDVVNASGGLDGVFQALQIREHYDMA